MVRIKKMRDNSEAKDYCPNPSLPFSAWPRGRLNPGRPEDQAHHQVPKLSSFCHSLPKHYIISLSRLPFSSPPSLGKHG